MHQHKIQSKRIVLITGATSGIGRIIACALARMGYCVIATARNEAKANTLLACYRDQYPDAQGTLDVMTCDLSDFDSVLAFANLFRARYPHLDVLINNAGVFNRKFRETRNGIEETFQVNYLAPFLLTRLLSDRIAQSPDGRVIFTSSLLHWGLVNFSDPEGRRFYFSFNAYRQSKLALILLARYLGRKNESPSTSYYSYHPGIVRTHLGHSGFRFVEFGLGLLGISPEKGAQTAIFLVNAPRESLVPGAYYVRKKVHRSFPRSTDQKLARKLYTFSEKYLEKYLAPVLQEY